MKRRRKRGGGGGGGQRRRRIRSMKGRRVRNSKRVGGRGEGEGGEIGHKKRKSRRRRQSGAGEGGETSRGWGKEMVVKREEKVNEEGVSGKKERRQRGGRRRET